jgi:hypothetical protein
MEMNNMTFMKLKRYNKNLRVVDEKVYSYDTHVATINSLYKTVKVLGWWSATTSKHISYVARELNYKLEF